jgi:hypothetical protein
VSLPRRSSLGTSGWRTIPAMQHIVVPAGCGGFRSFAARRARCGPFAPEAEPALRDNAGLPASSHKCRPIPLQILPGKLAAEK